MFKRGVGGLKGMGVPGSAGEFEQMARQYWETWEQALRAVTSVDDPTAGSPGTQQAWRDATKRQADVFAHQSVVNDAMERFGQQVGQWYAQMQQVAARFSEQNGRPADVVDAWKNALGGVTVNPFQHLFDSMNGPGMQGMEQWLRMAQPMLDALKGGSSTWLNTPAFGFTREHQERLQALATAQLEVQQAVKTYQELMANTSQVAFQRFERRLSALAAEGREIQTLRALFDVWVDAAEEAYAEVALSEQYQHAFGNLFNAQIRLRAGIQNEIEQFCVQFGVPTRTELDSVHRKIVGLERELRRMRVRPESRTTAGMGAEPAPSTHTRTTKSGIRKTAKTNASKADVVRTAPRVGSRAAKSASAQKAASKKTPSRTSTPRPRTR